MEKQKLIIMSSVAVFAFSLSVVFSSQHFDSLLDNHSARADTSVTIDNKALESVLYETFEVTDNRYDVYEVKQDKKFRIPLNNDQYILGAVIFNDCANQSIGNDLSDPMYMDNYLHADQPNAFNFNIVFGFEHLTSVTLNYFFRIQNEYSTESKPKCELRFKNRIYEGNSDEDFYNDLTTAGYHDILYKDTGRYYSSTPYVNVPYTVNTDNFLSYTPATIIDDCNMLVIQLTYTDASDFLEVGQILMFQIKSITFNFECL